MPVDMNLLLELKSGRILQLFDVALYSRSSLYSSTDASAISLSLLAVMALEIVRPIYARAPFGCRGILLCGIVHYQLI